VTVSITIKPLGQHVGAEIQGVDLDRPIDDKTFAKIVRAFHAHSVIRFRNGPVRDESVVALSACFGRNKINDATKFPDKKNPELMLVSNIVENGRPIGLQDGTTKWHADLTFTQIPPPISVLVAHEVCKVDGGTWFASTTAAWNALRPEIQRRLENLTAVHSFETYAAMSAAGKSNNPGGKIPAVVHPVVLTHPVTGLKGLYVSEGTTVRINGIPEKESRELLEFLLAHLVRPEFVWLQEWKVGDIIVWDNRVTQHRSAPYAPSERRLLKRTTVVEAHPGI
jgi:taurine dioxygenase